MKIAGERWDNLIDKSSFAGVDDEYATFLLAVSHRVLVDHVMRRVVQRTMQGDRVGLSHQLFERIASGIGIQFS